MAKKRKKSRKSKQIKHKFLRRREELIWSIDLAENDPITHEPYDIFIELVNEAIVPLAFTWKSYGTLIIRRPPADGEKIGEAVGKLMYNVVPDGDDFFTIPALSHIHYYSIYSAVEAIKLRKENPKSLNEKILKSLTTERTRLYKEIKGNNHA